MGYQKHQTAVFRGHTAGALAEVVDVMITKGVHLTFHQDTQAHHHSHAAMFEIMGVEAATD
jgi:hypothetical protein